MRYSIVTRIVFLATAVTAATSSLPASASAFKVTPVSVTLTVDPADTLRVKNLAQRQLRFSVHTYIWEQTATDTEKLTETVEKVAAFPQGFYVPPGAEEDVRVGVPAPAIGIERAYRIIIAELPPPEAPPELGPSFGLNMVGRFDIPVFKEPLGVPLVRLPRIADLAVTHGLVAATLANDGNVHERQSTLQLLGKSASGAAIWSQTKGVFYVLAQGQIVARDPIPARVCPQLRTLLVRWILPDGTVPLTKSVPVSSCK